MPPECRSARSAAAQQQAVVQAAGQVDQAQRVTQGNRRGDAFVLSHDAAMALIEFYPLLKPAHVGLVAASGALFAVRGAAALMGARWAMQSPWRITSYTIDTGLLAAGVALWAALSLNPVRDAWLGTKLALLLVYIVLGSLALKRARSPQGRLASYLAALVMFLFIASVARAHHPFGAFTTLLPP
jgi:uncharacterized membrane protein SirB2